jgi:hypothetical protein
MPANLETGCRHFSFDPALADLCAERIDRTTKKSPHGNAGRAF